MPIMKKLENLNVSKLRLIKFFRMNNFLIYAYTVEVWVEFNYVFYSHVNSGGSGRVADGEQGKALDLLEQKNSRTVRNDQESRIQAARERFLARKANK